MLTREWEACLRHFDVIIIGTGAGGGTLAYALARSGKKILLIERGRYLPREPDNWNSQQVFLNRKYCPNETWYDDTGEGYPAPTHYCVGGNTKFYGAALMRFRPRDFEELAHPDGISPAWPIRYEELEP